MNKTYMLALALALVAAPAVLAHTPPGTPKNYCENFSDWGTHDYGPPSTGHLILLGQDGNLLGDCNGDTVPADYDGHFEWALGGAWLASESGDGVTSGSVACLQEVGHHPWNPAVQVWDEVFGTAMPFFILVDEVVFGQNPDDPQCGDFMDDRSTFCPGSPCSPTFPPGLDGAYHIYVGDAAGGSVGTAGHITA